MNTRIHFLILSLFIVFNISAQNIYGLPHTTESFNSCKTSSNLYDKDELQTVYICDGSYAYAYHSSTECPGLNNCKGQIYYTNESDAINSYGRIPCCRCWSNVSGRCKDDNPSGYGGGGGGGDSGEALAIIGAIIITTSAFILSNDVYAYPILSFQNIPNEDIWGSNNSTSSMGWAFGLRKTFNASALEYGVTLFDDNRYLGFHLNYVHEITENKTPDWMQLYAGPTINITNDVGYGGVLGFEVEITERLKFDTRYELSSTTNNIKSGLIFTYQKEYFWNK